MRHIMLFVWFILGFSFMVSMFTGFSEEDIAKVGYSLILIILSILTIIGLWPDED